MPNMRGTQAGQLKYRPRILGSFLGIFAVCVLFSAAYTHVTRRVYFPFEKWPHSRAPRPVLMSQNWRWNKTESDLRFEHLLDVLLHNYTKFHRTNRFNPTARKLIYAGEGNKHGFGDRFRGILHAYQMAVMTERVLLLAWNEPFPLETVFESAQGMSVMYDERIDGGPLPRLPFYRTHNAIPGELPSCDCKLNKPGIVFSSRQTVVVRTEATPCLKRMLQGLALHSYLPTAKVLRPAITEWRAVASQAGGDGALYALIFRALIRPSTQLLAQLADMNHDLQSIVPARLRRFNQGSKQGYISVHARVGYGVGEEQSYARRFDLESKGASLELVAGCLAELASIEADEADLIEPQLFYIASDTPRLSKAFRKEILKWSPHATVMEIKGRKVHSSRMRAKSADDKRRFILTAADLFFLSAGERLVSLPSGFANLAKYFGDMPHKTVRVEDCVAASQLPSDDGEQVE